MPSGLGVWLRRARENRQLTLEEAEKQLRIRQRYLQALENGDYDALPGPVQARGFLRNYARFLGLPVEEALARYEADISGHPMQPVVNEARLQEPDRPSLFAPPPTMDEESSKESVPSTLLILLLGLAAFFALVAVGVLLYLHFAAGTGGEATPTPLPPTPSPAVITAEATARTPPPFVPAVDGTVHIHLEPKEHAWIRVTADDVVVFQGIATPGTPIDATASHTCLIETGNGGAFRLVVNDVDWGTLGAEGAVVRRAWTPSGEVPAEAQP